MVDIFVAERHNNDPTVAGMFVKIEISRDHADSLQIVCLFVFILCPCKDNAVLLSRRL